MHPLDVQELLSVWETGRQRSVPDRALLLLMRACPGSSWEELAALPIGERDARLLMLREWAFGAAFSSLASCPACGERLELNFSASDVRTPPPMLREERLAVEMDGYEVAFRLPNSTDLAALEDPQQDRQILLQRCLQEVRYRGEERDVGQLPTLLLDAVVQRMSEADPQADVHTTLHCPRCTHVWQAAFDIASFFWSEIESWAYRTLHDVHVLASAYGWSEAEVLTVSPWRRQFYLQFAHR